MYVCMYVCMHVLIVGENIGFRWIVRGLGVGSRV